MLDQNRIISCLDQVPSLSPTVTKILQVANDVNASANEMIQVIKMDPVLTAKILKLINSVYYGMPQKVVSLGRAVVLLGINTVKNLALSTAVIDVFKQKGRIKDFDMNIFWEHCLGCAVGSKLIAKAKGVSRLFLEEYFIAGLLHDIGKIALVQFAYEEYDKVLVSLKGDFEGDEVSLEEETMGTNHCKIGGLIAEKWQLPQPLKESILVHHCPKFDDADFNLGISVYLANIGCNQKEMGIVTSKNSDYDPSTLAKLDMTVDKIEGILAPLEEEVQLAKIFMEL